MAKIKVKLRDKGSIFRDASQGITLTGTSEASVRKTPTIMEAVRGGALILLEEVKETPKKEEVIETTEEVITEDNDITTEEDEIITEDEADDNDSDEEVEDSELSLTDLRAKYPEISARSKEAFLQILNERD